MDGGSKSGWEQPEHYKDTKLEELNKGVICFWKQHQRVQSGDLVNKKLEIQNFLEFSHFHSCYIEAGTRKVLQIL